MRIIQVLFQRPTLLLTLEYILTFPIGPIFFEQLESLFKQKGLPPISEESKIIRLAPELEARYLLIDKLLARSGAKQVLELAAGLSPRGLIMTEKEPMSYVELDLPEMAKMKHAILTSIKEIPDNLLITSGNALRLSDLEKAVFHFDASRPIAVTHEGLLRYLNFDEKTQVAENIKTLLKRFGGVWITCDTTPKKFLAMQDNVTSPSFNKQLISKTNKNFYENMFEDEKHVTKFFGKLGFSVEVHKFDEVLNDLSSPSKLKLNKAETKKLLESGTVAVMRLI